MKENMIWFKTVKLRQNGESGMEVTMPRAATRQAGILIGDDLDVYVNPETNDIILKRHEAA